MGNVLLLVVVVLSPTMLGAVAVGLARLARWIGGRRRSHATGLEPIGPPIEKIALDVRRLHRQRNELRRQGSAPGRGLRTKALTAAYVEALGQACRALEVEAPKGSGPAEVARVERQLRARGLEVHPAPVR